jgi:hypothetical protein
MAGGVELVLTGLRIGSAKKNTAQITSVQARRAGEFAVSHTAKRKMLEQIILNTNMAAPLSNGEKQFRNWVLLLACPAVRLCGSNTVGQANSGT